mmetsp:Transcript_42253/g.99219  ORF Transcript_42253/g.99219 Transcript_42253/m.99219 type:complete len:115 (+) Transcript_42253:1161-1505(+)
MGSRNVQQRAPTVLTNFYVQVLVQCVGIKSAEAILSIPAHLYVRILQTSKEWGRERVEGIIWQKRHHLQTRSTNAGTFVLQTLLDEERDLVHEGVALHPPKQLLCDVLREDVFV